MSQIGTRTGRTHEAPMEPAPLVAPPIRVPEVVPVRTTPEREPDKKAA